MPVNPLRCSALDEVAALGYLVVVGARYGANGGLQACNPWPIVEDMSQLKDLYAVTCPIIGGQMLVPGTGDPTCVPAR